MPRLLDLSTLEQLPVVANCRMNRLRTLCGSNGYDHELRINPLDELRNRLEKRQTVRWLDLCCGAGKALIEAARQTYVEGLADQVQLVGLDLVGHFDPYDERFSNLRFIECSIRKWEPTVQFDLITCVHGLHYVGDKLDTIRRALSWLADDGLFVASLDLANLRDEQGGLIGKDVSSFFRHNRLEYSKSRHLLRCAGRRVLEFPYGFLGADEHAGPNYTGHPAVNSHYKLSTRAHHRR